MNIKNDRSSMRKLLVITMFAFSVNSLLAQNDQYQFEVTGLKDTVVYLANYYGEKLYYSDTTQADSNGKFSFPAIAEENQGKYAVVIPGPKYFEIVIADGEKIKIKTDTTDLTKNLEVIESENNRLMYGYMDFLNERRDEREKLVKALEDNEGKPSKTAAIKKEYNALNGRVIDYQKQLLKENPNLFASHEIMMAVDVEPPTEILDDKPAAYYYYRAHYFDNIDLTDDRIIRTPVFHGRLVNYMNKTLVQNPDSISTELDKLIAKLKPGSEVFKYVVHYATYNYETSKIMGMDKVFVHLVDTYYKDDIAFWMEDDKLKTIKEKANDKRKTLIGVKTPELILADTSGNWISTYKDIKTKYILLFFYDPDCGHCKKETPKLVEFYNDYDKDLLSIYAVSSDHDKKWNKFIEKNEMDFYNVSIPQKAFDDAAYATGLITNGKTNYQSLKYQETFDIFSTPKVILIDQDRIIRAKDIGVEQVGDIIDRLEGKEIVEQ